MGRSCQLFRTLDSLGLALTVSYSLSLKEYAPRIGTSGPQGQPAPGVRSARSSGPSTEVVSRTNPYSKYVVYGVGDENLLLAVCVLKSRNIILLVPEWILDNCRQVDSSPRLPPRVVRSSKQNLGRSSSRFSLISERHLSCPCTPAGIDDSPTSIHKLKR